MKKLTASPSHTDAGNGEPAVVADAQSCDDPPSQVAREALHRETARPGGATGQSLDHLRCRMEQALDSMQLGVTITDTAGQILYSNPADAAMHGYSPSELIDKDVGIFSAPKHRQRLTLGQLRNVTSWQRESFNVRKDGTIFPVQLLSDVIRNDAGEPIGVVTTCEDIEERKRSERALQQSLDELDLRVLKRSQYLSAVIGQLEQAKAERETLQAQLRHAQKLEEVGQLTGGIAHDFNNILSVILANAELLVGALDTAGPEIRASVEDIINAGRTGATMVSQLLGFSRQAELKMSPTDLREVVFGSSEMLRRVIREDIEIRTLLDDPLDTVRADSAAVQQMLMNLVTNARDAMPRGGTIHIEGSRAQLDDTYRVTHPWVEAGEYVCLSVSDTGVGMDEKTKEKIFEPFFTTKPPGTGTGLGMAMIYGLMKQHRGFTHVYSELGQGTTVKLYFPAAHEKVYTIPHRESEPLPLGTETILVAEDEEALRRTAQRALEKFGYKVIVAANGAEALALYRTHRSEIDLILSDLIMPKMGGRDLYEAIQREGGTVKFMFASGYSARDAQARGSLGTQVPFLRKPWTLTELASQVRECLDQEPTSQHAS